MGLLHRLLEGHGPGDLEGVLRRVDPVVLAVVEAHPEILHGVSGERAVLHRLGDPLLHRRNEALRDRAALDLVDELEARARLGRTDLDVTVAELAPPPGLLLVAAV